MHIKDRDREISETAKVYGASRIQLRLTIIDNNLMMKFYKTMLINK